MRKVVLAAGVVGVCGDGFVRVVRHAHALSKERIAVETAEDVGPYERVGPKDMQRARCVDCPVEEDLPDPRRRTL